MDHLPSITALERTLDTTEAPLGRRVDLVERKAEEAIRNPIRRRSILAKPHPLYAA
jgi:hypothetical protein